jgi:hypothetical protein
VGDVGDVGEVGEVGEGRTEVFITRQNKFDELLATKNLFSKKVAFF